MFHARTESEEFCTYAAGQLNCADRSLKAMPKCVCKGYSSCTRILDASFNHLKSVEMFSPFTFLEELILDNNEISSPVHIPPLQHLKGISMNNNNITDLAGLIKDLKACPSVCFLSLQRNPVCPDPFASVATEAEYRLYRYYIIAELGMRLTILDSKPMTSQEYKMAMSKVCNQAYHSLLSYLL